jgi:DNA-binding NarL/FixJ family response regulator
MRDAEALVLLEIAYNLAESAHHAVRRIARAARGATPRGPVTVACFTSRAQIDLGAVRFERASKDYMARFFEWQRRVSGEMHELCLAVTPGLVGLPAGAGQPPPAQLESMIHRVSSMCVIANTGDGRGIYILLDHPRAREWSPGQLHHLHEIAQHLAIAWRLRTALAGATSARDVLRSAVVARPPSRTEPLAAGSRSLWQAIVAGQWSLLDTFTAAGTRYIVAFKNPAEGAALRALARRECSVLELALGGHSGKWISLELELCESTVARVLRTALRRVGVTDIAGLVGVRNAVFEPIDGVVSGVELAVARLTPGGGPPCLSDAERAIVMGLVGGKRAAAIARERGTAPRTVSNQLANVYRKLGVCSRREVLALLE